MINYKHNANKIVGIDMVTFAFVYKINTIELRGVFLL